VGIRQSRDHLEARARTLHDLEHGGNEQRRSPRSSSIARAHALATMARLNIAYDLLTYEGDIVRLQFWAPPEILKAQGAVYLQTEGKLAGCW
jgi:arginyl-tRNA synthetase